MQSQLLEVPLGEAQMGEGVGVGGRGRWEVLWCNQNVGYVCGGKRLVLFCYPRALFWWLEESQGDGHSSLPFGGANGSMLDGMDVCVLMCPRLGAKANTTL